ncbi:MAG: glycosyltransferase [Acidobacteriota bacterium]|nr:glycosyltransferase [Acidobacteriota bacterium]
MKKLLVSCDEYVHLFNGQYFLREFGNVLLSRYLEVFDKIRFAVRTKIVYSETELGIYNIPVIDDRIEIYPIPFFQGPKEYAKRFFQVKKTAKRTVEKCDAAIIRVPSTIGFVILNEVRKKKIPYAVEVVANPSIEIANSNNNILVKFLMKIIHHQQIIACKYADGASYVTQNALQKIYPAKKGDHFESYYSSVELPNIIFKGSRKYPKHNPFIICHVTNPIKTYNKGHITVIDTIKLLTENGFDVIAKFAGEGEFISRFQEYAEQKRIQDRIYFVGLLKQNELINFLEESDIMLFPTSSEGLPRVLIEAMATGLPCLSTNISGIPELLPKEQIYAPNDSLGFATRIKEIIQSPNLYEKLSKTAFKKAKEHQSEILQARRIQFYQKLKDLS